MAAAAQSVKMLPRSSDVADPLVGTLSGKTAHAHVLFFGYLTLDYLLLSCTPLYRVRLNLQTHCVNSYNLVLYRLFYVVMSR